MGGITVFNQTIPQPPSEVGMAYPITEVASTSTNPRENQKYVVAHHMVGNTYPYTIDTWKSDIMLAYANGIDGFALNIGNDDWQKDRVNDACVCFPVPLFLSYIYYILRYEAAQQSGTDFKLFLSFDMT